MAPGVEVVSFHDPVTGTASHLLIDPGTLACAVIDPVLDFTMATGRVGTANVERIAAVIVARQLRVERLLETHAHADHLTAAAWLKARFGGRVGIGTRIVQVQRFFKEHYRLEPAFATDGSQFDDLFEDGHRFALGGLEAWVLATPGHTPACVSYVVGDAAFVGDTFFMPDAGTARTDFPGGDAAALYRSLRRLLELPPATRLFVCHDYGPRRDPAWVASVAGQRAGNVHLVTAAGLCQEAEFVALRRARDATLAPPALQIPAVQVNVRAGNLPPPEPDGSTFLRLPIHGG